MAKAPSAKKRAERLVEVNPGNGDWCVEFGDAITVRRYEAEHAANVCAVVLRRILAAEFRKVRRAALLKAAKEVRYSHVFQTTTGQGYARIAADIIEALAAKPKRKVRRE